MILREYYNGFRNLLVMKAIALKIVQKTGDLCTIFQEYPSSFVIHREDSKVRNYKITFGMSSIVGNAQMRLTC